jgi:hypothetical protein
VPRVLFFFSTFSPVNYPNICYTIPSIYTSDFPYPSAHSVFRMSFLAIHAFFAMQLHSARSFLRHRSLRTFVICLVCFVILHRSPEHSPVNHLQLLFLFLSTFTVTHDDRLSAWSGLWVSGRKIIEGESYENRAFHARACRAPPSDGFQTNLTSSEILPKHSTMQFFM